MSDVVVTVPKRLWNEWLDEGDLPGDRHDHDYYFFVVPSTPRIQPGERVYVVSHGRLRGYAPLVRAETHDGRVFLVRGGDACAITINAPIKGFQGWRYRWWNRNQEIPFPDFATEGVAP